MEYSKCSVHYMNQEQLPDYILRIMREQNLSYAAVVARAEKRGYKITHSYISKIVSGAADNLSVEKIQALAAGLGRPEIELFQIAAGASQNKPEIDDAIMKSIAFGFHKLTKKDKELIALILQMLDREIQDRIDK